jgi:hypothetical protein
MGIMMDEAGVNPEGLILEDLGDFVQFSGDFRAIVTACAQMHNHFWGRPSFELLKLPNDPHLFQPKWGEFVRMRWPIFRQKWDGILSEQQLTIGDAIAQKIEHIQNALSSPPLTLVHGDVKLGNLHTRFKDGLPVPCFLDWQYIVAGKGVQDVVFCMVESYDNPDQEEWKQTYLNALGRPEYSRKQLDKDWNLALCHFPIYVCVWFGILPDEELTDPAFPPRFIMHTFNALINCNIASLLQELQ